MRDPLAGSPWSDPTTVDGFVASPANDRLLQIAAGEAPASSGGVALDIGCGAGRNAVPLARLGWHVIGTDLSWPMLGAAAARASEVSSPGRLDVALAPMDALPVRSGACHLIVAHGIWNLAQSSREFRGAVGEAGRIAAPGALLFVFTFSRGTLPDRASPVAGEPFVYTQFSGRPQVFLTEAELTDEVARAGFAPIARFPITEHNRPPAGARTVRRAPVILEAVFRQTRT